jgi:signal transduction histidine kinase
LTRSLRRSLAIRFSATMAVGLAAASAAIFWGITRAVAGGGGPAEELGDVLVALLAVVVLGTGATLVGAWWLAGSAVRPVWEITAQATHIESGTLAQRIAVHADTEEYRELVGVLNRMLERLERGFEAQRRLTADVGHELRTPLTAMRGEIEVALRTPRSPDDYRRVLHSLLEEIEHLSDFTDDVLFVTRAESRLMRAERQPADVNALVRDAVERWRPRFDQAGVRLSLALGERLPAASLDARMMHRLLDHLLENAVAHSPADGTVEVATGGDSGRIHLAVTDAGKGIPAAAAGQVFEPFFRLDPARTRDGGAGLGLSVVAAVARLHDGSARVTSVEPTGSRFEVDLAAQAA